MLMFMQYDCESMSMIMLVFLFILKIASLYKIQSSIWLV